MPQTPLCPGSTSSGFQLTSIQAFSCESQESQQSRAGLQLCLLSIKPLHNSFWFSYLVFVAGLSISSSHPNCTHWPPALLTAGTALPPKLP